MISTRRSLIQGAAAAGALGALPLAAQPYILGPTSELVPKGQQRRVVVLGGGWGGLTTARHLRATAPDLEVVLIEKNPFFWSCPLSNKWLVDVVDTSFLQHSYTAAARRHG